MIVHIKDPFKNKEWQALCQKEVKEKVTDDWFKVSCSECIKLMKRMMS